MKYSSQLLNAMFLVAGCCIGAGMLALPVGTAAAGFWPSLVTMTLAWIAMTFTGLCFVEVGFWMKKDDAHVISMSRTFLGTPGKMVSWCLYLFICYASLVAYIAGCGHMIAKACSLPHGISAIIFCAIFGPLLATRHTSLGKANSIMFIAMIAAYVGIVAFGVTAVDTQLLSRSDWSMAPLGLPLLLTAFSFQTMVPSLHPYLGHHGPSLRIAIIGGTSIAFVVYLLWQLIVHGTVPLEGPNGLLEAMQKGDLASHALSVRLGHPVIEWSAHLFAFFALVTSFFGIGLGLYDFLSDGLNIPKKGKGNIILTLLVLLPSLFFAINFERIFLVALDTSGGFGDTIQNGLIPIAMVWIGRYYLGKSTAAFQTSKGKWMLLIAALFFTTVFVLEITIRAGVTFDVGHIRLLD